MTKNRLVEMLLLMAMLILVAGCDLLAPECLTIKYGQSADIVDVDVIVTNEGFLYICPQTECLVAEVVPIGTVVRVIERVWGIGNRTTCEFIRWYVVDGYERDLYIPVDYTDASP